MKSPVFWLLAGFSLGLLIGRLRRRKDDYGYALDFERISDALNSERSADA